MSTHSSQIGSVLVIQKLNCEEESPQAECVLFAVYNGAQNAWGVELGAKTNSEINWKPILI